MYHSVLCFVMFTRHKLSMTMRHFILLGLSMFINHPSNSSLQITLNFSPKKPQKGDIHFIQGLMRCSTQNQHLFALPNCSFFFFLNKSQPGCTSNFQMYSNFYFPQPQRLTIQLRNRFFPFSFLIPRCWHKTTKEKKLGCQNVFLWNILSSLGMAAMLSWLRNDWCLCRPVLYL